MSKGAYQWRKGDGKGKSPKEVKRFQRGKAGHIAKERRGKEVCFKRDKTGHRQKDCKEVPEVAGEVTDSK